MVGLGEELSEVQTTLADLRRVGCGIVTIGQYLRPSIAHLPVARYYTPVEFSELAKTARDLGFGHVEAGRASQKLVSRRRADHGIPARLPPGVDSSP